jgi:glutathione synthase/RimK-type ligase-like ATP-grasp enzyme
MFNLAFATCRTWMDLSDDDRLVTNALRGHGASVRAVIWDAPDVDWSRFDAVVIRSTWDYHLAPDQFASWVRRFEQAGPRLWNPPEVVLQNMHKSYLTSLAAKDVQTVPSVHLPRGTEVSLQTLVLDHGWEDVVIKPAISAAAYETWRTSLPMTGTDQGKFAEQIERRDLLIQPYIPEIASKGEWSLVFLGGSFSHAVLKRPSSGDFRVQREFGGTFVPACPPPALIDQATSILSMIDQELLYARLDAIERDGRLILMELELIEPFLFLGSSPGAVERFAEAIIYCLK